MRDSADRGEECMATAVVVVVVDIDVEVSRGIRSLSPFGLQVGCCFEPWILISISLVAVLAHSTRQTVQHRAV